MPHSPKFQRPLKRKALENILVKGENAGNPHEHYEPFSGKRVLNSFLTDDDTRSFFFFFCVDSLDQDQTAQSP